MKYRLLKDYATPFCFVPAGTVGEVDGGYYNFTSGEDGFSFPAQDVRKATDWFEEIKESESQEKCRNAWHPKDCPGNTWKITNGELFAGETNLDFLDSVAEGKYKLEP